MQEDNENMTLSSGDVDSTLEDISKELQTGETLILEIENNRLNQTDKIYDTLVMRGYDVRKSFKNGRNQIIVNKKRGDR